MSAPPVDRRAFLAAATGAALTASCRSTGRSGGLDLVLAGGEVLDGTGGPAFRADVGLAGDTIVRIGAIERSLARRVLDVSGLCLAPGFVDVHSHSDRDVFLWPLAESRVRQGCTTEITGNCGSSAAPRDRAAPDEEREDGPAPTWTDVRSYRRAWDRNDAAINHALLVGHGSLRRAVVGSVDRVATEDELRAMERRLEEALDQGAIGLSTGLEYVPGIYSPPAEIERLARCVARRGGLYASHMRSEEELLFEAIDEAVGVGRRTGVRVQVSHLKAAGRVNWHKQDEALERLARARAAGVDVMADAYPYTAYSTSLSILLEPWSREGGAEAIVARLRDPALRARMRAELGPHVREREPGGFDLIVISSVARPENQACVGRNLEEIATAWSVEPEEAGLRLLETEAADVGFVGHGMSEANVERVLAHPLVMIGSDGRVMAPREPALATRPHPRSYGTFPRVLGHYCRDRKLFDLPTAVRKMSALPAERAGLADRGRIAPGKRADLVAFDAARIRDEATFDDPHRHPTGIVHVLVNGEPVVESGAPTGARPGRFLAAG